MGGYVVYNSFKGNVPGSMVAMIVGIDQYLKILWVIFLQFIDEVSGLLRKFRVHDRDILFRDIKCDRTPFLCEDTDVIPQEPDFIRVVLHKLY